VSDTVSSARLPRWVRRAFWSIVAIEWTVALGLTAVCLVGVYWGARYMSCADASTVYSSGYSEVGWSAVTRGDTQAAVRTRLGEPLQRWDEPSGQLWSYSGHGASSDDYLERKLLFDMQGRVVEKHEECYLD
jgi:hypothetical protein